MRQGLAGWAHNNNHPARIRAVTWCRSDIRITTLTALALQHSFLCQFLLCEFHYVTLVTPPAEQLLPPLRSMGL